MANDGTCQARDFFHATTACRKSLLSLVRQYAQTGKLAKMGDNGHRLVGEFEGLGLFEFKPGDFRFMSFRNRDQMYLTNGGPKESRHRQVRDYRIARDLRDEFFASLRQK